VVTKTIRSLAAKPSGEKPSSQAATEDHERSGDRWEKKVEEELKQYD